MWSFSQYPASHAFSYSVVVIFVKSRHRAKADNHHVGLEIITERAAYCKHLYARSVAGEDSVAAEMRVISVESNALLISRR